MIGGAVRMRRTCKGAGQRAPTARIGPWRVPVCVPRSVDRTHCCAGANERTAHPHARKMLTARPQDKGFVHKGDVHRGQAERVVQPLRLEERGGPLLHDGDRRRGAAGREERDADNGGQRLLEAGRVEILQDNVLHLRHGGARGDAARGHVLHGPRALDKVLAARFARRRRRRLVSNRGRGKAGGGGSHQQRERQPRQRQSAGRAAGCAPLSQRTPGTPHSFFYPRAPACGGARAAAVRPAAARCLHVRVRLRLRWARRLRVPRSCLCAHACAHVAVAAWGRHGCAARRNTKATVGGPRNWELHGARVCRVDACMQRAGVGLERHVRPRMSPAAASRTSTPKRREAGPCLPRTHPRCSWRRAGDGLACRPP